MAAAGSGAWSNYNMAAWTIGRRIGAGFAILLACLLGVGVACL